MNPFGYFKFFSVWILVLVLAVLVGNNRPRQNETEENGKELLFRVKALLEERFAGKS